MWDIGTKEWNEYYHGKRNRIRKVSERAKRNRSAMKSNALAVVCLEQVYSCDNFDLFESECNSIANRDKHVPIPEHKMDLIWSYLTK